MRPAEMGELAYSILGNPCFLSAVWRLLRFVLCRDSRLKVVVSLTSILNLLVAVDRE
jgi:precorrin-2 methylase